ncbi:MAG: VanZ family protein [Lachnospiraceae bacterium]|nr:VanZ family protein [Lachnospiraceae bacterium]
MKKSVKKSIYMFLRIVFIVYVFVLSYLVFFSERYGRIRYDSPQSNLVPFQEIHRYLSQFREITFLAIINVIGNTLIFVPFGALLFIFSKKLAKFHNTVLLSLLLSLAIETTQYFTRVGVFDVDDIMLNTLGGIIGWIIYKIVYGIYKGVSRRGRS